MFKTGDRVVCVDASNTRRVKNQIKIHSTYIVDIYDEFFDCVYLNDMTGLYTSERFITLKEYRKQKLQKLNENR